MPASVYLETTVVSYLVANPSKDLLTAAHQKLTHEWWTQESGKFSLFVSELVIQEAGVGDQAMAAKRLQLIASIPSISLTNEIRDLAARLIAAAGFPKKAEADAVHIAAAAANSIEYLLTWNCRHIANAQIRRHIEAACRAAGYSAPVLCTPEELIQV